MIKVSDYIMKFLVSKGVRNVFMLPGGGAMHLVDSLGRCKELTYTSFLHEQALAIAVESFSQFSGFVGVGLVTSGPGGTNTITGVTAAYLDSTPCIFISGQVKRSDLKLKSRLRQKGPQEVDIISLVSPITKYSVMVLEPKDIRYHLEKAWVLATTARKGPVWLDIPLDVQSALIDEDKLKGFSLRPKARQRGLTNKVKRVISLLNKSKCPLILAGNGVRLSEAQELLSNFIEVNQIPVLLTWKAIDFFDSAHTLNFGSPGIMGSRFANFIVQNCDLLLILGSRLDPSITAFNSREFGKNATRVMVDIDRREISKIPNLDLGVVADMGEFLTTLQNNQRLINLKPRLEWLSYCKGLKEKYPVVLKDYSDSKDNINLYYFIDTLFKELSSDDVITPESSGSAGEVTYQAINVKKGQKIRNAAGLGSMGFGLPYAIGACIATGIKRTILINGDGAFQLNIQELEVVARLKLPIKMFILENNGYGSIMATQRNIFNGFYVGAHPESGLTLPNLSKIANTYGITYVEATNHNDLTPAIKRSLQADGPVLCAVKAKNHITSPRVQSLKLSNGGMISKPLEDMWPYLSPEEIKENMLKKDYIYD